MNMIPDKILSFPKILQTKVETELISSDVNSGVMKIKAIGKYQSGNKVSEDQILNKIKGKKIGSAKTAMENTEGVYSASVTIKPSIVKQVPYNKNRIKIQFGFENQ
jgi:hypothetical protein